MTFDKVILSIFERLAEQERRISGAVFKGKVAHVDPAKKIARIIIGNPDGVDVLSPELPIKQVAGALKLHSMPSVGQTMQAISTTGDIEQAVLEPLHWSDANPSPSDDDKQHVLTIGKVRMTLNADGFRIEVGEAYIDITESDIRMKAGEGVEIDAELVKAIGESLMHNDKEVGDTHRHLGDDLDGITDVPE